MKLKHFLRIFKPKYPKSLKNKRIYRKITKSLEQIIQLQWMLEAIGKLEEEIKKIPNDNSDTKDVAEKLISKLASLINKYNKIL